VSQPPPDRAAELDHGQIKALRAVLDLLATDPASLSSQRALSNAWSVHVEDSLSALSLPEVSTADRIADIGSGAGFPGLPLAVALPEAEVTLIESVGRKCAFIERAIAAAGIANARAACERAEDWARGDGREAYDLVTARAVGRLSTLSELASPLLAEGGHLVCWKGRRDPGEEAEMARASPELAVEHRRTFELEPLPGRAHRTLYLMQKAGQTPEELPRRAGMAKKRPYGHDRCHG
jgi:16S rRNA (guanine527-N7)-methyltransferase